eukprot:TCONS_00073265-protein
MLIERVPYFNLIFILILLEIYRTDTRAFRSRFQLRDNGVEKNSVALETDMNFTPGRCVPITFNQTVTKRGCIPVKIQNNLCYGTCGSMYIPYGNPLKNDTRKETFFDCRHCIPSRYQLIRLPMYCPGRRRKHRTKRVLLIHDCSCSSRTCYLHSWNKR